MSSLNVLGFGWLDLPLLPFSLSDKANENGAICLLWPRGVDNTCIYMYVRDVWPGHMAEPSPPDRCCHRLNALQIICSLSKFAPRNWVIATMAGREKWPLILKKLWNLLNDITWELLRAFYTLMEDSFADWFTGITGKIYSCYLLALQYHSLQNNKY